MYTEHVERTRTYKSAVGKVIKLGNKNVFEENKVIFFPLLQFCSQSELKKQFKTVYFMLNYSNQPENEFWLQVLQLAHETASTVWRPWFSQVFEPSSPIEICASPSMTSLVPYFVNGCLFSIFVSCKLILHGHFQTRCSHVFIAQKRFCNSWHEAS